MAGELNVATLTAKLRADTSQFTRGMAGAQAQMRGMRQSASVFDRGATKVNKRLNSMGVGAQVTGQALKTGLAAGAAGAGAALIGSAKAAIDWESAFAGVRKTVDASPKEFAQLESGIREMATQIPTSANELAGLGEIAGQLGVPLGEGGQDMLNFIRTTADLGETTNLTSEAAATAFARIANIMDRPISEVDRMGSTVVDLGNNLATTEQEIANFALRVAGAGKVAGLTSSDVLAIGGAFSSVGVRAERGGTAVSKVIQNMVAAVDSGGDTLDTFAETAGVSAQEFAQVFEQDAAQAFTKFVEGLGEQGDQAFGTLEELGLADQRLMQSFVALAGAGDLLRESIDLGTDAFEENNALTEEAEKRYETTASELEKLRDNVIEVGIKIGSRLLPAINDLASGLQTVLGPAADFIDFVADLNDRLGPVSDGIEMMLNPLERTKGIVNLASGAVSAFDNTIGSLRGDGQELVDLWMEGVEPAIVQVAGEMSAADRQALLYGSNLQGLMRSARDLGVSVGDLNAFIDATGPRMDQSAQDAFEWSEAFNEATSTALDASEFSDDARESFGALKEEMRQSIADVRAWKENLRVLVDAGFEDVAKEFIELGPEFSGALADLVQRGESGMREISALLEERAGVAGFEVGQSLGTGIGAGLNAAQRRAQAIAVSFVGKVITAAKAAAEIGSPSELTAREIGVPMAQGVAEGLERGSDEMAEAMERGVDGAIRDARRAFDSAKSDFVSAFEGFARSVSSSFESEFNLLRAFDPEEDQGSIVGLLQGQTQRAQRWAQDMQTLAKVGLDQGLLQQLAEAGPKAAPLISQLLDEVREGNLEAINQTQEDLRESLNNTIEMVGGQLAPAFAEGIGVGQSMIEGMAEGIAATTPVVQQAIQRATADAVRAALRGVPTGGGATVGNIDALFQEMLGRRADPSGLLTFFGMSIENIRKAIRQSAEFQGRAHGGPVQSGRPFLVGERGPELFVPDISGDIISNGNLGRGGGGMAGGRVDVVVSAQGDAQGLADLLNIEARASGSLLDARVVED